MILWFCPICAYYAERKFCHKYTHALSSVWNRPPYTRIIRERNFAPDIYEKSWRGWNLCAIDWVLISLRSFVSCFYLCGRRLNKTVFIDWLMSKFGYKSVIKLHKFIVKMWLCICNCMYICVCIWYWLWFVVVLIGWSSDCSRIDEVRLV